MFLMKINNQNKNKLKKKRKNIHQCFTIGVRYKTISDWSLCLLVVCECYVVIFILNWCDILIVILTVMEPEFERRLIRSMSGCSSVSSSPFSSPVSSPSPIKHSDRFIPLRSLSQPSAFFIDQEQIHKGPMSDRKSSRESSSTTNTGTNSSSTSGTTNAADRAKDMLTYQALLQNEMFGTNIDYLYDEQHMNSSYSNESSNNHNSNATTNSINSNDVSNNGVTTAVMGQGLAGQIHTTANSAFNVSKNSIHICSSSSMIITHKIYFRTFLYHHWVFYLNRLNNIYHIQIQIQICCVHVILTRYFGILLAVIHKIYIIHHILYHRYHPHLSVYYVHHVNNYEKFLKLRLKFLMHQNFKMIST